MAKIIFMTNNNNLFKIKRQKSNFLNEDAQKTIADSITKLYKDAERRVYEYGTFREVKTNIKNKNSAIKDIELTIKPSLLLKERPKERELEITATSIDGLEKYSVVLERGEKEHILNALSDEKLVEKIDDFITNAQSELKRI